MAPSDYCQPRQNGTNDNDHIIRFCLCIAACLVLCCLLQEVIQVVPCANIAFQQVVFFLYILAIDEEQRDDMERPPTLKVYRASASGEYCPDLQGFQSNRNSSAKETATYNHALYLNVNLFRAAETIPEKASQISKGIPLPCSSVHTMFAQLSDIFKYSLKFTDRDQYAEEKTKKTQEEESEPRMASDNEELICKILINKTDSLLSGINSGFSEVDFIKSNYWPLQYFQKQRADIEAGDKDLWNVTTQTTKGKLTNLHLDLHDIENVSEISNEPCDGWEIPKQNGAKGDGDGNPRRKENCGNAGSGGSFSCSGASGGSNGGGNGDNGRGKKNSDDVDVPDDEDDNENDDDKKKGVKRKRRSRGRRYYINKSGFYLASLDFPAQANFGQMSLSLSSECGRKRSLKRLQYLPCFTTGPRTGQMSKNARGMLHDRPEHSKKPHQTPLRGSPKRKRKAQPTPLLGIPRRNGRPQQTPLRGSTRRGRKPRPTPQRRRGLSQITRLKRHGAEQSSRPDRKPPEAANNTGDNTVTHQIGAESPITQEAAVPDQRTTCAADTKYWGQPARTGSLCQGLSADSQSQAHNSRTVHVTADPRSKADSSRPPEGNILRTHSGIDSKPKGGTDPQHQSVVLGPNPPGEPSVDIRQEASAPELPGDARQVPPDAGSQEAQADTVNPGASRHAQCQEDLELERLCAFGPPPARAAASGNGRSSCGQGYLGAAEGRTERLRLPRELITLRPGVCLWAPCEEDWERDKEMERMLQTMRLYEENQRLRRIHLCRICETERFYYVLLPCGHTACRNCANTRSRCSCGQVITGKVRASFTLQMSPRE